MAFQDLRHGLSLSEAGLGSIASPVNSSGQSHAAGSVVGLGFLYLS